MRHILIIIIFFISINQTFSQADQPYSKFNEIDLSVNSIINLDFGVDYKTSINKNTLLRIQIFDFDFTTQEVIPANPSIFITKQTEVRSTIGFGIEKRKALTDKLLFFSGIDILLNGWWARLKVDDPELSKEKQKTDNYSIHPCVGFKSGLYFKISEEFKLGFSVFPQGYYKYTEIETTDHLHQISNEGDFKLSIDEISLSVIYKWNK